MLTGQTLQSGDKTHHIEGYVACQSTRRDSKRFLSAKTVLVRYILVPGYEAPEDSIMFSRHVKWSSGLVTRIHVIVAWGNLSRRSI